MKTRYTVLTVSLLLLMSIVVVAQKVYVDYDKGAPFSTFQTYAWKKGTPASNPFTDQRIVQSIDTQLMMKGLVRVPNVENANIAVAYHASVQYETVLNTFDTGWGWGYYGGPSTTTVEKIPEGTLIVDIGDVKTKKLLWRGTATDTVNENPEKLNKKIDEAIKKMFKKYPPEVKRQSLLPSPIETFTGFGLLPARH